MFPTFLVPVFLSITMISQPLFIRAHCPDKCGDIPIPFPFGTKEGCYRPGFDLTCNTSFNPPRLYVGSNPASNIQLLGINLTIGEARALKLIGYACFNQSNHIHAQDKTWMSLDSKVYLFSAKRNKFTVIGCYALGYIVSGTITDYQSGCLSFCNSSNRTTDGSCNGLGCCQTSIPEALDYYEVQWGFDENKAWSFNPCTYAVLMEEEWYKFNTNDLIGFNFYNNNFDGVPFVLDWAIRDNGMCSDSGVEKNISNPACLSKHSTCYNTTNGEGYLCQCGTGYEGNPYIQNGCQDINECKHPEIYKCSGICNNTKGSYDCTCPEGTEGNATSGNCTKTPKTESFPYPARVAIVCILVVAVFVAVCFLVDAYKQKRMYNKKKEEHLKYYEMMAGSLRVFTEKEIKVATNNFDENLVLGAGGHGKVYTGILENNDRVAIKKSKEVERAEREEFVNEIILLSRINHKNIVRILGCCLEVKIPMLVYEFVPKGSLFDLLHGKKNNRPIPLATRIKIALGSAEALDYLHNSIARSIIHGDVKSANILLDDTNTVKVSDFGASNLVPTDDTEFIKLVQGTRGYLDPECWSTQIITKSSDVYSFGVILLELITRRKAIYIDETNERTNLATNFVSMANKNKINEMLDKDIMSDDENVIEVLQEVSDLALWCLSVKGDDRPTMKQVVEKLYAIVKLNPEMFEQTDLEDSESLLRESSLYYTPNTSLNNEPNTCAFHSTESSSVLDIEVGNPR